ncbi:MAG: exodeoxyribonuclease V subunit gamma, partial [Clostridia bacterium]|nr:exodeoxyribonuclease V subunit gamma [Clostridia bacterium]
DNIKDYCGILDVMMQRHGISFRITDNRDILQSPCVKFIISALNIIIYNWQFDDVISYIKSGFCSCSDEECDIIEEYASTWSLSGSVWKTDEDWNMNPQGYSSYINDQTFAFLEKINNIRDRIREPVINLSLSLKDNRTGKNTAEAIYRFLTDSIDPSQLKGDDISSWNAVVFALEQLALCAGDEKINDIETLKRLLRLICSQTSFSMLPSTIDEISVVSIGNLRSVDAKRIYIIGANEGSYPADYKESNILDDMLCEELRKNGLTLMHDPQEMLNEQKWLFYKTILSAKESVVVSYHTGTLAGKELLQSNAVTEIQRLFPQISSVNYKDLCITDLVYDKPSAFDYADDEEYGNLIKEVLLCDESYKNSIEGFDTPISTNECSIKDPSNLSSYNGNMSMTQSKLEKFVKCRFSYRMTYDLCLKEQQKVNYDPRDIGNFIHKVLEDFFKAASQNKLDSKSRKELVDKIVDRYIADTCGNMKFVSKRLIALFEKLRRNAHIFVRSIYEEFEDSEFVPSFFEMDVSFGEDSDISPYKIKLSDGTQLYIKGKIDRVDTFEKNGKVYFRVVDYKTGKKDFKVSDLEKGINLQMFLYMFSIMENKEKFLELINKKGELIPSGVIYYIAKILPETYNEIMPQSMIENDIITGIERQGMILSEDTLVDAMSKSGYKYILPKGIDIEKGKGPLYTLESLGAIQGKINDVVNKIALEIKQGMASAWPCEFDPMCEYCSHYNICRINKEGEGDDE